MTKKSRSKKHILKDLTLFNETSNAIYTCSKQMPVGIGDDNFIIQTRQLNRLFEAYLICLKDYTTDTEIQLIKILDQVRTILKGNS